MKTVTKSEMKFVGVRVICSSIDEYPEEIARAVDELHKRLQEIPHTVNPDIFIGVFKADSDKDEDDGYWKCVEVEKFERIPDGMDTITVPAQKYVATYHEGTPKAIHQTYDEVDNEIDRLRLERILDAWHLELYDQTKQQPDHIRTWLYQPVKE